MGLAIVVDSAARDARRARGRSGAVAPALHELRERLRRAAVRSQDCATTRRVTHISAADVGEQRRHMREERGHEDRSRVRIAPDVAICWASSVMRSARSVQFVHL